MFDFLGGGSLGFWRVHAGAELREESEAVNESFWDATGVEIEAKQVLGKNARHGLTWIFGTRNCDLDFWASKSGLGFFGARMLESGL